MDLNPDKTVREIVVEGPGAERVFETFGIDYCCKGDQSLEVACANAEVALEDVVRAIGMANEPSGTFATPDFRNAAVRELIDHIVEQHHAYTKTELLRLRAEIDKVNNLHGRNHPELARLRAVFQTLAAELEPHMLKEECVLFPYIIRMDTAERERHLVSTPPFRTVKNPIDLMQVEHAGAGYLLERIRQLTSNYTPPADTCKTLESLYRDLAAFEADLHQHIHLENNILFPRAIEMEMNVMELMARV